MTRRRRRWERAGTALAARPSHYGSRLGPPRWQGRGRPRPRPRPGAPAQDGGAEQRRQRRGGLALQRGHGVRAGRARRRLRGGRQRGPGHPGGGEARRRPPAPGARARPCRRGQGAGAAAGSVRVPVPVAVPAGLRRSPARCLCGRRVRPRCFVGVRHRFPPMVVIHSRCVLKPRLGSVRCVDVPFVDVFCTKRLRKC